MVEKRRAFYLGILLIVLGIVLTGIVQSAGSTEVGLRPSSERINTGETTSVDLVVKNPDNGVGTVNITITSGNADVLTIESVDYKGTEAFANIIWPDTDNSTVRIEGGAAQIDGGTIATIDLRGVETGSSGLKIDVHELADKSGSPYSVTTTDSVVCVTGEGSSIFGERVSVSDVKLDSGMTVWRGQRLLFDGSGVVDNIKNASREDRMFQLREVTGESGTQVGQLVSTFIVNTTGKRVLGTNCLTGQYIITYQDSIVQITDGVGTIVENRSTQAVRSANWEVTSQSLSARVDEDDVPIRPGDTGTIELDSNRGGYVVNVTAEQLDAAELKAIFGQESDGNSIEYVDQNNDVIGIAINGNDITANFSRFTDPGIYEFHVKVADAAATDSTTIELNETNVELAFTGNRVFTENAGDPVNVSLTLQDTNEAWIFIGNEDVNILERVGVQDDNDDGEVTVQINTFTLGNQSRAAYTVSNDDELVGVTQFAGVDAPNHQTLDGIAIDPQSEIDGALDPDEYLLRAASLPTIRMVDGQEDILEQKDMGVVDLKDRETKTIDALVAPRGPADGINFDAVRANATDSDTVALSDRLLIRVNASGLYGYVADEEMTTLYQQGLELRFKEVNTPPNRAPAGIDLRRDGTQLYTKPAKDTLFVVVDLRNVDQINQRELLAGQTHQITFAVSGGGEKRPKFPANRQDTNPLVSVDKREAVRTTITLKEPTAKFDGLIDGTLQVRSKSEAQISGTTTLAPNSELTVRLRSTDSIPISESQEVRVDKQGRFTGTFDLAEIPTGTNFTAIISANGEELQRVEGRVVNRVGTPTPTPTLSPTPQTPTVRVRTVTITQSPVPTVTPEERTVIRTRQVTRTIVKTPTSTETPGQPGFGVMSLLIALLVVGTGVHRYIFHRI